MYTIGCDGGIKTDVWFSWAQKILFLGNSTKFFKKLSTACSAALRLCCRLQRACDGMLAAMVVPAPPCCHSAGLNNAPSSAAGARTSCCRLTHVRTPRSGTCHSCCSFWSAVVGLSFALLRPCVRFGSVALAVSGWDVTLWQQLQHKLRGCGQLTAPVRSRLWSK